MAAVESAPGQRVAAATAGAIGPARPRRVADLVALARPAHWTKNLLVVPVALIDPALWSAGSLGRVAWAVVGFTIASCLVYLGNDLADRHRDRHHPRKRHRPIASGRVSGRAAVLYGAVLAAALAALMVIGPHGQSWPILAYLCINLAYSAGLKHVAMLDAGTVSAGYVLRAAQGFVAAGGIPPAWLLVTIFCGALLLVMGKRRQELRDADASHRPALRGYSAELADHLLQLTAVLAVTAGLVYLSTQAPFGGHGEAAMLASTPFVLFGVSRYLQLVLVGQRGGDPVRLLRDPAIAVTALLGTLTVAVTVVTARYLATASIALP